MRLSWTVFLEHVRQPVWRKSPFRCRFSRSRSHAEHRSATCQPRTNPYLPGFSYMRSSCRVCTPCCAQGWGWAPSAYQPIRAVLIALRMLAATRNPGAPPTGFFGFGRYAEDFFAERGCARRRGKPGGRMSHEAEPVSGRCQWNGAASCRSAGSGPHDPGA